MFSDDLLLFGANSILFLHFLYVSAVVLGQTLILIGALFGWQFIRRPVCRMIHLLMIVFVALLDLLNLPCPLTVWENQLRELAGKTAAWEMTFVQRILHSIVFITFPANIIDYIYIGFAALVILTFLLIPPQFRSKQKRQKHREKSSTGSDD